MDIEGFFSNPASQTLLIPLLVRAQESESPKGLFKDKAAQELVAKLPAEHFSFRMHPFMRIGTAVRIRYFDDIARKLLKEGEQPVIVQLGCGLDTRFSRIDNGRGIHINIDLPDVIALREQVLTQKSPRCSDWAGNLLDRDWMDRLEREYAGSSFVFIAEGVLMYLEENEVRRLFADLAERFPASHIVFDTAGSRALRIINKKSAVSELKASLVWGYDDDHSIDSWHPRLRRVERAYYFATFKARWGLFWLVHFTPMGKASALFHFQVAGE